MRMRRRLILALVIFLLFAVTGGASARGILDGETCNVEADTVIEGNLFVLCGELRIDGHVRGSVIGGARSARINGMVDGSVYLFGGELIVTGELGKDIHFAGLVLDVTDTAAFTHHRGSILSANLSGTIAGGSTVPGHITSVGYQLIVNGDVGGEVNFWGSALTISGEVEQDVTATVGNAESGGASSQIETLLIPFPFEVELIDPGLILEGDGAVRGQLDYTGPTPGIIDGTTERTPIYRTTEEPLLTGTPVQQSARSLRRYFSAVFREFLALGFIGVLTVILVPRYMLAPVRRMQMNPVSSLGVGMLSFILSFPIVLIVALLSVVLVLLLSLLPLDNVVLFGGIVLGLANIGGASVFYFTAIYIARVVFALAVGRLIVRLTFRDRDDNGWRYLLASVGVGVFLMAMAGSIPIFGWGFNALALFMGLGAILGVLRQQMKKIRSTPTPGPSPRPARYAPPVISRLPYTPEEARRTPPPLIDDEPPAIGMDNLPEGFNWWGSAKDNDG
ncbi:MAG: hypothetical protein ACOCX3_01455 [Chloroflexota bacterium]